MKPPICEVCNERFEPSSGALIRFVADGRSIKWRTAAQADGRVGHPPEEGWFCSDHAASARTAAAVSTLDDAIGLLRSGASEKSVGSDGSVPASSAGRIARDGPGARRVEFPTPSAPQPGDVSRSASEPISDSGPESSNRRRARPWIPDDHRIVVIHPLSVDSLAVRLNRFFEEVVDACAASAGFRPDRDDDETITTVRQYDSPEWREKGPASEEVQTTTTVLIGDWRCWMRRSRHDWLHGGIVQTSASVGITDVGSSPVRREMSVTGGSHGTDAVIRISVSGSQLAVTARLLDALIDELHL